MQAQYALISVSDKAGLLELASSLTQHHIKLLATQGTASMLTQAGFVVSGVDEITEFPEILDGRVKTLHPKIFGGILAQREKDADEMTQHELPNICFVIANLYPFKQTALSGASHDEIIEKIDIGGVSLLRAAAKNYKDVTVAVNPADYQIIIDELKQNQGQTSVATRQKLAMQAFQHVADYDIAINNYFQNLGNPSIFSENYRPDVVKLDQLRYGENPHQAASVYQNTKQTPGSLTHAEILQGKALSYNNFQDADAAWRCLNQLNMNELKDIPACVIVKHANPCGAACSETLLKAYENALACDPVSAFGGIIAFNQSIDKATAEKISTSQFAEVIIAPEADNDAKAVFAKKKNLRVLLTHSLLEVDPKKNNLSPSLISGGLLVQQQDSHTLSADDLTCVTKLKPTPEQIDDLLFAWQVVKYVKSNAIVYAKNKMTLGIGAGQMSRIFAAEIAARKAKDAKLDLQDSVLASDAFFPFPDGIEYASEQGVKAIIQPGGSKRDQEVIDAADKAGIVMVFTGIRCFRH